MHFQFINITVNCLLTYFHTVVFGFIEDILLFKNHSLPEWNSKNLQFQDSRLWYEQWLILCLQRCRLMEDSFVHRFVHSLGYDLGVGVMPDSCNGGGGWVACGLFYAFVFQTMIVRGGCVLNRLIAWHQGRWRQTLEIDRWLQHSVPIGLLNVTLNWRCTLNLWYHNVSRMLLIFVSKSHFAYCTHTSVGVTDACRRGQFRGV